MLKIRITLLSVLFFAINYFFLLTLFNYSPDQDRKEIGERITRLNFEIEDFRCINRAKGADHLYLVTGNGTSEYFAYANCDKYLPHISVGATAFTYINPKEGLIVDLEVNGVKLKWLSTYIESEAFFHTYKPLMLLFVIVLIACQVVSDFRRISVQRK